MKEGHGRSQSNVPLLPYTDSTPPSTPMSPSFRNGKARSSPFVIPPRRRALTLAIACLSVISLGILSRVLGLAPVTAYISNKTSDAKLKLLRFFVSAVPSGRRGMLTLLL